MDKIDVFNEIKQSVEKINFGINNANGNNFNHVWVRNSFPITTIPILKQISEYINIVEQDIFTIDMQLNNIQDFYSILLSRENDIRNSLDLIANDSFITTGKTSLKDSLMKSVKELKNTAFEYENQMNKK